LAIARRSVAGTLTSEHSRSEDFLKDGPFDGLALSSGSLSIGWKPTEQARKSLAHEVTKIFYARPFIGICPDQPADQSAIPDANVSPRSDDLVAVMVEQGDRVELVELPILLEHVAHAVDRVVAHDKFVRLTAGRRCRTLLVEHGY
jgi:hypothetical protein